jgi:hypothetical protein
MSLSINANLLRELERKYNVGKPFDAERLELLKDALFNITDEELRQGIEQDLEGLAAREAGDLEKFDPDAELESKIELYILKSFSKAKFPELRKEHQAKQPPKPDPPI